MGGDVTDDPVETRVWVDRSELDSLRSSLQEAQSTLEAIRNGEVDAVVVHGEHGHQIYSLSGAEQPYRVYVEQMQEGAVTVGADGLVLYSNQRFADMVGLPLDEVISSSILAIITPESWASISAVLSSEAAVVKHEAILSSTIGARIPVHFTASTLPLADQTVICLVVTDLSLQKSGEDLRLAKEVAERANIAKDSFLAALSHELRTPLTPALMAISAMHDDPGLPGNLREDLAMIRRNIQLETRLIDDLLDLTRIANGKLELHEAEVDLHAIIHRAIEIARASGDTRDLELRAELHATEAGTTGDAVRLQQVFWNIIRNAIKFTPAHGSIRIVSENPRPGLLRISITDTGIGFDPDQAGNLFQPFTQVGGRETTRQFGGLGLGLAISRSIMLAHGGEIRGESAGAGCGATFHVDMPIRHAPVRRPEESTDPADAHVSSLRVLLVEDHDDTREVFELILRRRGHQVVAASNAQEALAAAEAQTFDIVISDVGLPDVAGTELMAQLRDRYGLRGIAVSGYGMEQDLQRSREAGFIDHLTKPIDPGRLETALAAIQSGGRF